MAKIKTKRPNNVSDMHLIYLDDLRESGKTNMYGAGQYLEAAFGIDSSMASKILAYWMGSFGDKDK